MTRTAFSPTVGREGESMAPNTIIKRRKRKPAKTISATKEAKNDLKKPAMKKKILHRTVSYLILHSKIKDIWAPESNGIYEYLLFIDRWQSGRPARPAGNGKRIH